MSSDIVKELAHLKIDWSDFEAAGHQTRQITRRIGTDKAALRALVDHAAKTPELLAQCERHQLLHYLVVTDGTDRGFRLRIHLSTQDSLDRPHDHRFSFSSYIARGKYTHVIHRADQHIYNPADDERTKQWMNRHNPDPVTDIRFSNVKPILVRDTTAGNCYSMHHSVIHSTITTPGTVSIFLRGPAEKDRSVIMDKATQTFWWRFSKTEESAERRQEKTMTQAHIDEFRATLERLEVI